MCELSTAQVLISESFEEYAPGQKITQASGQWHFDTGIGFPYRPEPRVSTAKDGITPFSGTQMLEFRSHHKPGQAQIYRDGTAIPTGMTSVSMGFRLLYAQGITGSPGFYFNFTPSRVTTLQIDPVTGIATFSGEDGANDEFSVDIPRNKWIEIQLTFDLAGNTETLSIGGLQRASRKRSERGDLKFLQPLFAVGQREDLSALYTAETGVPCAFFDSLKITAVPEPASLLALGLFFGFAATKNRPKS